MFPSLDTLPLEPSSNQMGNQKPVEIPADNIYCHGGPAFIVKVINTTEASRHGQSQYVQLTFNTTNRASFVIEVLSPTDGHASGLMQSPQCASCWSLWPSRLPTFQVPVADLFTLHLLPLQQDYHALSSSRSGTIDSGQSRPPAAGMWPADILVETLVTQQACSRRPILTPPG